MFCAPELVSGGTEDAVSRFQVLRSRTRFGRYRGRRFSFSCFALPDTFWAVPRASGLVYMFCAPGLFLGVTEGAGSSFHVLRSRTRFRRYRGPRFPFSCFALTDYFWALPRTSGLLFKFCAPGLVSGGTEDAGSRFHVLHSRTSFGRYRRHRFPFSCFALTDTFWAVPRAPVLVFMFCAPGHVLGVTEGVGSRLHVLRSRTRFRKYRGRRISFTCFALPDSF
jgi:hypothetical protein